MRSIYAKILLWSFGTLLASLVAFFFVSRWLGARQEMAGGLIHKLQAFELASIRDAYETGGAPKAAAYIDRMNRTFGAHHHFVDARGKDLITGENRSAQLALVHDQWFVPVMDGHGMVVASPSPDRRYFLIVTDNPHFQPWTFIPYYGPILLAVALLCWPLAFNIGSPLRSLAAAVDRFGQGDLSIRVQSSRRDEIGDLARSFDRMADRIETLLTAERRLLQDVSHELRSPLARLSFAAELVRTAPDREAAVARLKKEISRLTDLVSALIQVTRAEGDPSTRERKVISMNDLLEEVVDGCRLEAAARNCEIEFNKGAAARVTGDPELLRRAVENILRNAIQYAPEGSSVIAALDARGSSVRIGVRDYGPGVPPDLLSKIFQPFFRVDDSRNGSTGGIGLGLSIAMRAVSLHHGTIRAENAGPGLRVEIELPAGGNQESEVRS